MADISKINVNNTEYNLKDATARSDINKYKLTILSYGNSTWDDFYTAYSNNAVVYCRASSASNPATGSQTRLAFMAYVNNGTDPTEVEFQYYRSVSSHNDSQQGDQVYVYKLNKTSGWSVTTREAYSKLNVTAPIVKTYQNQQITLSHADSGVTAGTYDSVTVDAKGHVTAGTSHQQAEIDYAINTGVKNVFSGSFTNTTLRTVEFIWDSNSGTLTANGTATGGSANLASTNFILKKGTYIFSSSENSNRDVTYDSYVYDVDSSTTIARDNSNDSPGTIFTIAQDTNVRVNCRIASGYNAQNVVFKPMIRDSAITNDTFESYAPTNRELFELIQDNDNIISGYVSDNTGTTKTVITSGVNATKSVKDGTIAYITFKEDNTATYTDITTTGISLSVNGTSALISEIGNECYDYDNTSTVNPSAGAIDTTYIELNPRYGVQGCTNLYIYKDFGNNNTKWMYLCSTGLDLWSFYNFTGISVALQSIFIDPNTSGRGIHIHGSSVYPFALATCDTATSAQNKVATVSGTWVRSEGCIVAVKYSKTNTYSATSDAPVTLNVNGTGAANIYYGASATPTGTNTAAFGYTNRYIYYMWDGTYWVWLSQSTDNNTTYSEITQANITNGSGTSSGLITGRRAKQAVDKFAFGTNTQITSGSDFDSYTTVGVYYVASDSDATNITHCPVEYHGRLEVITTKSDSNIMQIYYSNISSIDCPQIFVRVRATNWGGWVSLNGQSVGIQLSTGDDLDNIVNPGIYQCGTVTKAKSLLHTPFADATTPIGQTNYNAAAFKFIVENVNSPTTLKQTIIPLYGTSIHFERTRLSGVWSTWYVFSGVAVI